MIRLGLRVPGRLDLYVKRLLKAGDKPDSHTVDDRLAVNWVIIIGCTEIVWILLACRTTQRASNSFSVNMGLMSTFTQYVENHPFSLL